MFIGAAAGIAASNLPGLELVPAVAMGIGAMCTVMLTLPLTATLLATLLLGSRRPGHHAARDRRRRGRLRRHRPAHARAQPEPEVGERPEHAPTKLVSAT